MVATILQTEGAPASYPAAPAGLSAAAAALSTSMLWLRIEPYIAWRYTSRTITWAVEGPGDWQPPLKPATISTVQIWTGEAWQTETLLTCPLGGYQLPAFGPFKFVGTVGGGTVPAAVNEAIRRLAEYMAQEAGEAGARTFSEAVPDVASTTIERSASWMAQALQNSGAADLLRSFRRA